MKKFLRKIALDETGAALVETALALPILSVLLSGIITYAMYFMAAHSLQSVANEGARASIAGLDETERQELVGQAIENSMLSATLVDPEKVTVRTGINGSFYTVTLDYDASESAMFTKTLVPMPGKNIVRSATVDLLVH